MTLPLFGGDSLRFKTPPHHGGDGGETPTSPLQCYQRGIRETSGREAMWTTGAGYTKIATLKGFDFGRVSRLDATRFIQRYEWLGYAPGRAMIRYGLWRENHLYGVEMFSNPPLGVYQLLDASVRKRALILLRGACSLDAGPHAASMLIGACLRDLRRRGYGLVIAYADPAAGEHGVIYRAAGAVAAGWTVPSSRYALVDGKWYSRSAWRSRFGVTTLRALGTRVEGKRDERYDGSRGRRRFVWVLDKRCELPLTWRLPKA